MNKSKKAILKIAYIAVFSALCFAGTSIAIPFGASKVHLGNFFCILAGLLCGGLVGGLSGSIGMTLNDIIFGYPYDTFLRTMITKFFMGLVVGSLFRLLVKRRVEGTMPILINVLAMAGLFIYILTNYIFGTKNFTLDKVILISILFGLNLIIAVFSFKIPNFMKLLLFSLTIATSVNVVGEFYLRIVFKTLGYGLTYSDALTLSMASLPGALMTSIVTMILTMTLYNPVYFATKKINKFNDLEEYITLKEKKQSKYTD